MITAKFITPFGYFEVLHNGQNMEFSVEDGSYDTFYINGETPVHPTGCYTVSIETINMEPGDVVTARYSETGLEYDGGDEHTLNAMLKSDHFTIGIGCDDTDDLEELWSMHKNEMGADIYDSQSSHLFPYAHWGITEEKDGFEFHIMDDPKQYTHSTYLKSCGRTAISLSLVWNKNDDEYAWDIVSALTC